MSRAAWKVSGLFLLAVVHSISSCAAPVSARPISARPISARGEAADTLVVFNCARSAYSLGHELEFLKLQLRRVATRLEAVSFAQVTSNQLSAADYLVIFCPQPEPGLGTNLFAEFANTNRPVLWVGYGAEQLTHLPALAGQVEPAPTASTRLENVTYRGRDWTLTGDYWIPVRLAPGSRAQAIIRPSPAIGTERLAVAWQAGHVAGFSAMPTSGPLSFLLSDFLLGFYGITNTSTSRVFLRIDDYQAASDHREFKRVADYLASRGHPFILPVTPSWKNSVTGKVEDLDGAPEFVTGLRHAQARGGRIILRGTRRATADRGEFWDPELDRPPVDENSKAIRERIENGAMLLLRHGILPLAWQTPDDAASGTAYAEIARVFATAVERPQLSDVSQLEKALLPALTEDRFGRQIIPENLGYLPGSGDDGWKAIEGRAKFLVQLRGNTAGCIVHAYQPLEKFTGLVAMLEGLKAPFLDLVALDNWVHVPGHVLLTGKAQRRVKLAGGIVTWKAFDRTGRLVANAQEFAIAGERTLQRKGDGDIELFEFRETIP